MTLEGADEEIVVAKQRGPRSIVAIHRKRTTPTHADSACPGTADLSRFIRLLRLINEHCPWANKSFGVNDSILKELVSNHLNLIVGQQNANKYGPRLRSIVGAGLTPSNVLWITNRQQGKTTTLSKL